MAEARAVGDESFGFGRRLGLLNNARTWVFLLILAAVLWSLSNEGLVDSVRLTDGAKREMSRFFSAMLKPTLTSEGDTPFSLWPTIADGVRDTVAVAFAAMTIAIALGFAFGCLASEALWESDRAVYPNFISRLFGRVIRPAATRLVRAFMAALRSVHELVWALILTSMFSVHILCGIAAIAIPYAATLGRIYGEMIDEVPRDASRALRTLGAGGTSSFLVALLPRALPAMLSYTFYRFDCCLRSSAVLGFVGLPTLGLHIKSSFNYAHYREVWTFLWILFALLAITEVASAFVRRRMIA